jgi:6-pyruvoyltetrahydropterin/6-carboxytetrahydropterin synthase
MVYLTRKEHFNAAHRLFNPKWSKEQNEAVFGKCANEYYHGHNYDLFVTVKGQPNEDTGFIMDAKLLGDIIKDQIIEQLDHKNINIEVPFMTGILCSTENLAKAIWAQLIPFIPVNVQLHCIRLHETNKIYVEYFGE